MHIQALLIGQPMPTPAKAGTTGHFKTPIDAVEITRDGLQGDHIADLDNHGGVDQAVYIFTETDRAWWQTALDRDVPPGFFGENMLVSEMSSADFCIGDRLSTANVVLEISSPRIPCATYSAHIGDGQAIKQFYAAGRPGAYARVIQTGRVTTGDPVTFAPYTGDRISMDASTAAYLSNFSDAGFLERARHVPAHYKVKAIADARLSAT